MNFEEQELVAQLVRTALLAENEQESLAAMRAAKRKMAALGFDRSHIGVLDQSKGVSTTQARLAMDERDRMRAIRREELARAEKIKATITKQKKQIARLKAQIAERAIELEAVRGRMKAAEAVVEKVREIYVESLVEGALRKFDQRNAMSSS